MASHSLGDCVVVDDPDCDDVVVDYVGDQLGG
jgi:hypothetical protein